LYYLREVVRFVSSYTDYLQKRLEYYNKTNLFEIETEGLVLEDVLTSLGIIKDFLQTKDTFESGEELLTSYRYPQSNNNKFKAKSEETNAGELTNNSGILLDDDEDESTGILLDEDEEDFDDWGSDEDGEEEGILLDDEDEDDFEDDWGSGDEEESEDDFEDDWGSDEEDDFEDEWGSEDEEESEDEEDDFEDEWGSSDEDESEDEFEDEFEDDWGSDEDESEDEEDDFEDDWGSSEDEDDEVELDEDSDWGSSEEDEDDFEDGLHDYEEDYNNWANHEGAYSNTSNGKNKLDLEKEKNEAMSKFLQNIVIDGGGAVKKKVDKVFLSEL
jgi:hypothetical protein